MGMCLALSSASDQAIAAVLADPPLIWKLLAPEDPEVYESARRETRGSWLSRIFGGSNPTTDRADIDLETGEDTDLDKSWNGIHYLLTGTAVEGDAPLNFLIHGGREVAGIDVGYGPARVLTSREVMEIGAALATIDRDELRRRFDPEAMAEAQVYPDIWADDAENALGYCLEYYDDLKSFIARAVTAGNGIVISIQ